MELKRGKTFIKSSLVIAQEKPKDPAARAPAREDEGPRPRAVGAQPRPCSEKGSQTSPCAQGYGRCPSKETQSDPEVGPASICGTTFKLMRKSRTHDSVPAAGKAAAATGHMVGSVSFPETPSGQRMIDYRHFVPQMPFVPAVAKSIPRKRISLKRSKKCFRNLFHMRRNKTENLGSLAAKGTGLPSPGIPLGATTPRGKAFLLAGEGPGLDSLCQDLSDCELVPDTSFDLCSALCEDVASLKSFDSLTGCGEIFADGSSVPSLELSEVPMSPAQAPQALDSSTPRGPSQGCVEQLASPAQNEASDFTKFWDSVNRSVRQQQRALLGPWLASPQGTETEQPKLDAAGLAELPLFPCRGPPSGSKASSIDTGTPKSEQPESVSTSDEGYYDSFSPGLEEDKKEAVNTGTPAAAFPRDSYSGDALYELFYDPSEAPVGPSLDDDLCVSESVSGPALGTPLSMCSFHVGAEENLAPAPGPDLLSQGFLQSSWKGKECLLKLCDTELAITMGIVNWLRRTPSAPTPASGEPTAPPGPHRVPRGLAENPEARRNKTLEMGKAMVCSVSSRQELWSSPGIKDLLTKESKAPGEAGKGTGIPSKDSALEEGTQECPETLSSVGSAAITTGISNKSKDPAPPIAPSSQEDSRLSGNPKYPQGLQRPGHGANTLDLGPRLVSCVARGAAVQIYPDGQPPRQDMDSGFFRQPQAWGADPVQQKQTSRTPNGEDACGPSSLASPQDQRCSDFFLDLNQLRLEPTRLGVQAYVSGGSQSLQPSPTAPGQAGLGGKPDSRSSLAPAACRSPQRYPPEKMDLALDSQQ